MKNKQQPPANNNSILEYALCILIGIIIIALVRFISGDILFGIGISETSFSTPDISNYPWVIPITGPTDPNTPTPYTKQIASVEMAVLNITTEILADGTIRKTADLSIEPLGIGTLQLTTPIKMKIGESYVISLAITPTGNIITPTPPVKVLTPTILVPVTAGGSDGVFEYSDTLQIYPVMAAELTGVNFEIVSDGHSERPITSSSTTEWTWNITPKIGNKQTLILVISVPVIIEKERDLISVQALKNIPIEVHVELTETPPSTHSPQPTQTPIPTLTPTPIPPIKRICDKLIENIAMIVTAVIGLAGVIITAYVAYLAIKKSKPTIPRGKGNTSKK